MKRIVKDPEERRAELIDTAEQLFLTKGYDQTSISDIAKEVPLSKGAFYYYFESKEDVLMAVLEKKVTAMEEDFRQILSRSDMDEAAKLNSMINLFIRNLQSGYRILGFIQIEKSATLHQKLVKKGPFGNIAPIMAEVISKGCEKGRFCVVNPLETSYILLWLLASANVWLPQAIKTAMEEEDAGYKSSKFFENVRTTLEDLIGKAVGITNYRFILQI
jgi:AcrR family transcriptional regulator